MTRLSRRALLALAQLGDPVSGAEDAKKRLHDRLPSTLADELFVPDLPDAAWSSLSRELSAARSLGDAAAVDSAALYEAALSVELSDEGGRWNVVAAPHRRHSGSHYTPETIADEVVQRTLAPLTVGRTSEELLRLSVCDPAMGGGVFLRRAAVFLAERLLAAREREQRALSRQEALLQVCTHCLHGIDQDPLALLLSRLSVQTQTLGQSEPAWHYVRGNSLLHAPLRGHTHVDWPAAFPKVFGRSVARPGFDAIVTNPPWVAYVGRATQPLSPELRQHYLEHYESFHRYRTLHGLFAERCAQLLRPGGRMGLVVPTSMADLAGYSATRQAHDALAVVDPELPDLGDGRFSDVFQPSMVLLSTRRHTGDARREPWTLQRRDLDPVAAALLQRLQALPKIDARLFGERGYQTAADDRRQLRSEAGPGLTALLTGTEISEFRRSAPRCFASPDTLSQPLRAAEQWQQVLILIRQTARYPIAAAGNGCAFRNSVLAGFESNDVPWPLLLSYLNSSLVRWFHFQSHRDARQGMPQLKVGHLRALPAPPATSAPGGQRLLQLGTAWAARNAGLDESERSELDQTVNAAFGLSAEEGARVERWRTQNPLPRARRRGA